METTVTIHPYMIYAAGASLAIAVVLCFGVIPAAVRIKQTIHPHTIYASLAIVVAFCVCFFVIIPAAQEIRQSSARSTANKRTQLTEIFPPPWLGIYDACSKIRGHQERALFFDAWMREIKRRNFTMPKLSLEAIQEFAAMVAKSWSDGDYVRAAEKLTPFLELEPLEILMNQEEHDGQM